jgi:hypothetical protein
MLLKMWEQFGNHWSIVAKYLPGRSQTKVRDRWKALRRAVKREGGEGAETSVKADFNVSGNHNNVPHMSNVAMVGATNTPSGIVKRNGVPGGTGSGGQPQPQPQGGGMVAAMFRDGQPLSIGKVSLVGGVCVVV